MTDVLQDLAERVRAVGSDWTKYSVVGSFVLYVVGYLALRFHLTAIGVGTDLAVLDERYLFTGARFAVYVVAAVPSVLLMAMPFALGAWGLWKVASVRRTVTRWWLAAPAAFGVAGIIFAVLAIQLVMRQCFTIANLLLAPQPMQPSWLVGLLLDDRLMPLYFSALVAACAVPLIILAALRHVDGRGSMTIVKGLLAFLAAVQVLLLPINYGVLIVDKTLPRVAAVGDKPLTSGDEAWLVWEGKDGVTYLVRSATATAYASHASAFGDQANRDRRLRSHRAGACRSRQGAPTMTGWWTCIAHSSAVAAALLAVQTTAPKETFLEKLLRIAGLTAAPSQMRGPSDEVLPGNIWTVQVSGGAAKALTTDGGYLSPVFSPSDGTIYALRKDAIVRVPIRGGAAAQGF